jgi:hypothetical protein
MRPIAGALMFAVAMLLSASCFATENMTPAQKACCAAMAHNCGEMAVSDGCCAAPAQEGTSLSAAHRVDAPPPALLPTLVAVLDLQEPLALHAAVVASGHTTPVKPPGTHTYLVVSSFRL